MLINYKKISRQDVSSLLIFLYASFQRLLILKEAVYQIIFIIKYIINSHTPTIQEK